MTWKPYPVMSLPATRHPAFARERHRLSQAQAANVVEQLRRQGPIVTVHVSVPASAGKGTAPQTVKGLVDTGASISTVDESVAAAAGLFQTGSVQLGGVGGSGQRPIYAASFSLPEYGVTFDPIEIAGVSIPFADVQVLIGRDFLQKLRLDYRGNEGVFALTQEGGEPSQVAAAPGMPTEEGGLLLPIGIGLGITAIGLGTLFALDVI